MAERERGKRERPGWPRPAAGSATTRLGWLAEHGDTTDDPVPVAIETPRGLLTVCLRAAGRQVYPVNSMAWPATGTDAPSRAASPTR